MTFLNDTRYLWKERGSFDIVGEVQMPGEQGSWATTVDSLNLKKVQHKVR